MAQNFYTKWQDAILADAGDYVSKEYRSFQTTLVREISKYAAAVGAKVASNSKGHYDTSCFIERNGKFVYIRHSSTLARMGGGVRVELDSFLIRTAQHAKDYRGGYNQYCDMANLQSMMDAESGLANQIRTGWSQVDLSGLGDSVCTVAINFKGSDSSAYGLNTPAYVAIDDIDVTVNE